MEEVKFFGVQIPASVALTSILIGGIAIVVAYLTSKFIRPAKNATQNMLEKEKTKRETVSEESKNSVNLSTAATSSKRAKNKKRREAQQEFTHSWMVGALKGHTAPVLDMNFSSNGKFLASCAEDRRVRPEGGFLDPGETDIASTPTSPSCLPSTTKSTSFDKSIEKSSPSKEDRTILSRRQRKNRTRLPRDQRKDEEERRRYQTSPSGSTTDSSSTSSLSTNEESILESPKQESKIVSIAIADSTMKESTTFSSKREELRHLSDTEIFGLLKSYVLSKDQLTQLGYPLVCDLCKTPAVYLNLQNHYRDCHPQDNNQYDRSHHSQSLRTLVKYNLDVNAREFVPTSLTTKTWNPIEPEPDSGHCSGNSRDNSDLEQESLSDSDKNSDTENLYLWSLAMNKKCVRCHKNFYINRYSDDYMRVEDCYYHWGKLRSPMSENRRNYLPSVYECCKSLEGVRGCTVAKMHVWNGSDVCISGPLIGYVRTEPCPVVHQDGNYGVYGLDCEMCYTKRGLELTKVTLVNLNGEIVYDTLVQPDSRIIDYNTRFSGITPADLATVTKTLEDVQNDLVSFISAETILIGHGLENDLRSLKIVHTNVIDTCVAFPHHLGYPYRCSLKTLARSVLWKEIQVIHHDSVEDARVTVELILRKLQIDLQHCL